MKVFVFLLSLVYCMFPKVTEAQQVPIGSWRSHLPYKDAFAVADAGNRVYCATHHSLFYYDKEGGNSERLSTINGMAEVAISAIAYNAVEKILVIGYANGNIDLLDSKGITNLPFIKLKNITANKVINSITMSGSYAYLSCGFGIVKMNLSKQEITDSYSLSPAGTNLQVNDLALDGSYFYAATDLGIFTASLSNPILSDYSAWTKVSQIPKGVFTTITFFNNKIYTNYSTYHTLGDSAKYIGTDTVFVFDGSQWTFMQDQLNNVIRKLETSNNKLVITNSFESAFYDANGNRTDLVANYQNAGSNPYQSQQSSDGTIWIADAFGGLIKNTQTYVYENLTPGGPGNTKAWSMSSVPGTLYVSTGGVTNLITNNYQRDGFHVFTDETWTSYTGDAVPILGTYIDNMGIAIDPNDSKHMYTGFWGSGIAEFTEGKVTSTIPSIQTGVPMYVSGLGYDSDNILWFAFSSGGAQYLGKIGTDKVFSYFPLAGVNSLPGKLTVDSYGQKWIIVPRGGGLVAVNETLAPNTKILTTASGQGTLPSADIFAVAEDLDGQLWIGSSKGVAVIFSPGNVFSGGGYDAQQILVEQDGHAQYLLETEVVTAIAVDGANRKWFGTDGGGVFLMSADGTLELLHFTKENSPLLSNTINCISIDGKTGEVFFGTDKGIVSYRGTATEGGEEMGKVYAFPNPVRADYTGLIGIKGLTQNASVKITDISGALVYETIADGGQAVWNGKNTKGVKAGTGVYLVYCSNKDGSHTFVTKLFFVN